LTYSTSNVSSTAISNYAKSGNGAARITLLSSTKKVDYGTKYEGFPVVEKEGYGLEVAIVGLK